MRKHGKIKVKKTKKGFSAIIIWGKGNSILVPSTFAINMQLDDKECEFIKEKEQIVKIIVEGKELYRKSTTETFHGEKHQKRVRDHQQQRIKMKDSYNIKKTKLPSDTRGTELPDIDNFNLKLNKAVRFEETDGTKKLLVEKPSFFQIGANNEPSFCIRPNFGDIKIQDILNRQYKAIKSVLGISAAGGSSDLLQVLTFEPDWRMVIGLGQESVYEISINLHHIYGIPYIPGQAIKGIVRSWVIQSMFNNEENTALKSTSFRYIFGGPAENKQHANQGRVIFFDAFPIEKPKIEFDIMNPHYSEYYSKGKPPADNQSPILIPFLTVGSTPFQFIVGTRATHKKMVMFQSESKLPLEWVKKWLVESLELSGIGAKTAVGYGHMHKTS